MNADWVERASQLLQSKKIAASVILGAVVASGIALYARNDIAEFQKLSPPLQWLLAGGLVIVSYAVGAFVVGIATDIAGFVRGRVVRQRTDQANRTARESERAEKEGHLRVILSQLTTAHYECLSRFTPKRAGDPPSAILGPSGNSIAPELQRLGFITEVTQIERSRSLHELTPAAAIVVPPFLKERRIKRITNALSSASEAERTILFLFAEPDPQPGDALHDWMDRATYAAVHSLTAAYVLTTQERRFQDALNPPATETFTLTPDAAPLIEEMILRTPIRRSAITLDLSRVEGTGASGSGARGSH